MCSNGLTCDEQGKQVAKHNTTAVANGTRVQRAKQSLIAQAKKAQADV
jgi:hypothetical protein